MVFDPSNSIDLNRRHSAVCSVWIHEKVPTYRSPLTPEIAIVPDRLPLIAAMQDQLGLELEPGRARVEVLVIDRAERLMPD